MDPAKNKNNHMAEPWKIRTDLPIQVIATELGLHVASISAPQNAKRIVECVNAMEGIEDPMAYMQSRKCEMKPVAVQNFETIFADNPQQLEDKMVERITGISRDLAKFQQLKEVIQSMLDQMDQGQTLTKDSVYVLALREAFK